MTNVESILKQRHYFVNKGPSVKAMVFPVVTYGCENWTIKKAEHWRINAFELWCWRSLLRVPGTARRSNQSILKEINPEYSLERLMLKLKLQYSGHLMWRADPLEKTLMLGKIERKRRRGWQRMRWLDSWLNGHEFEKTQGDFEGQGSLMSYSSWSCKESDTTEWLNNNKWQYLISYWCRVLIRNWIQTDVIYIYNPDKAKYYWRRNLF